ncbi:MAG: ATP-binding protein, partial [Oscillospiraceae bacterium]|nr:ATP-binding protein [Oscillospiraceae bacterium]
VLALDVDISWLMGYAESLQFVEGGYGMIVSQYLQVIAHPNERYQGLRLREMGPGYYGVADMLQHNRSVANERIQDSDGSSAIVFFKQLYNDWYVGVVMPLGSYLADLYLNIALLAALGLVLSLILSFILLRLSADKIRSEEESRSKSSFLAMMSHEMRTPMNAIIGMTTIAKRSGDAGRKDYALDKIEDASSHLLGVINNILDMSKIEAGKLDMHPVDFDFAGLMDSVTGIVNFKVNEKGLRLTLDLDEHIPARVRCDDQRLAQILTNLLSNAVKFTPDGGSVALTARLLSMDGKECLLWFEVADDGIGIGKEQQARLFTPFVQAERSTASKYGGTGLGLYLTKRIVELMGGSITLTSAPGKGTAFTFTVAAEAAGDAEGVGAKAAGAGDSPADGSQPDEGDHGHYEFPGRRILLAEDLDINREIVLSLLESTMVSIDCASDGKEAVRMYRESESGYDMVFMDVQMPVMDGFEATRAIRALDSKGSKDVPIIAMTANVFKEDVENCLNAGMDAHVGKPIDYDALLQVMERYLGDPGTPDAGG